MVKLLTALRQVHDQASRKPQLPARGCEGVSRKGAFLVGRSHPSADSLLVLVAASAVYAELVGPLQLLLYVLLAHRWLRLVPSFQEIVHVADRGQQPAQNFVDNTNVCACATVVRLTKYSSSSKAELLGPTALPASLQ